MSTCKPLDHEKRVVALQREMAAESVDLVLLFHRDNVRYFTGFRINKVVSSILAIPRSGPPTYVVARLDMERAKRDCWISHLIAFPEDTPDLLSALDPVLPVSVQRIGVEHGTVTLDQANFIKGRCTPDMILVNAQPLVDRLRLIKSEAEIERLRESARIASNVMKRIQAEIRPGLIEAELAAWTEHLLVKEGAEGSSFEAFMTSGANAWLPQRVTVRKPIQDGDMILLDMGGVYDGYCSDITRTLSTNGLLPEQRRLFDSVRRAYEGALDAVRPGAIAHKVDASARDLLRSEGYGEYFTHLTGHGIGLSTHEGPIVDEHVGTILEPGMVFTVEPGAYVPGVGAARIEDMVLVTETGYEMLTDAPREIEQNGQVKKERSWE